MNQFWKFRFVIITIKFVLCFSQIIEHKYSEPRIVGGIPANLNSSKFVVSIRLISDEKPFGNGHICGGTLFMPNMVLTAAHCLIDYNNVLTSFRGSNEYIIVMGTLNRFVNTKNTLQLRVAKALYHKQFNLRTMKNDIAIMIVIGQVPLNHPTIAPISIVQGSTIPGKTCRVYGWGALGFGQQGTSELRVATIGIVDTETCAIKHQDNLKTGMICAGSEERDSCQGDSGGPLECDGKLVGIVSWGEKCATPGYPGIYTDVNFYEKWINDQISNENNDENFDGRKHIASIRFKPDEDPFFGVGHICGGALIDTNDSTLKVVTVAHCLFDNYFSELIPINQLTVVLGTLNRLKRTKDTLQFNVKNIKIHDGFQTNDVSYDIAVLELDGVIPQNHSTVQPIKLINFAIPSQILCTVDGWGGSYPQHRPIKHLRTTNVTAINREFCNNIYGGNQVTEGLICAGELDQLQDPINTDDGGPLTCQGYLTGLLVERMDIALAGYPSIFTDIYSYSEWIAEKGFACKIFPNFIIIIVFVIFKYFLYD